MNEDNKPKLNIKQQITEKILSSENILIVGHNNPDGDALGSSLAIYHALKKINKKPILSTSGTIQKSLNFLPGIDEIQTKLKSSREFVITLDTSQTQAPHKVKYKTDENKIHLIISPEDGNFSPEDITFTEGNPKFDLIITLDTPNLEYLGDVYNNNHELFTEVPIINIDHHSDNTSYGELNFVNTESSSVAEILTAIIESISPEQNIIDQNIATCILTGILSDTGSFQNNNTTSKALTVSAQMIAAGANHQAIIRNLFKTQSLAELKAWGKILTNLQTKPSLKLAWSKISLADLQEIGATAEQTSGIIDALMKNLPDINIFMLLTQTSELIKGSLRSLTPININPIATELGGGGHNQASGFRIHDMTLVDAEELALNTIEKHLSPVQTQNLASRSEQNLASPPAKQNIESQPEKKTTSPTENKNVEKQSEESKPTNNNTYSEKFRISPKLPKAVEEKFNQPSSTIPPDPDIDPEDLDTDPNAEPFDPTETNDIDESEENNY